MKNWSGKFALAFATTSVLACRLAHAQGDLPMPAAPSGSAVRTPAIALLDAADAAQWQTWTKDLGWKILLPAQQAQAAPIDTRIQSLDGVVHDAVANAGVDPGRVYLAGRGDMAAWVFYAVSRMPDLWTAALALGGSPEPALTTGRVFAVNFTSVPVLWISGGANDQEAADKLKKAGVNLEWRAASSITNAAVFEWLKARHRDEFPLSIDCETNSQTFGRCYWIQMTKFDPGERNDVLPGTRVSADTGATLGLGEFGFKQDDPGPGLLVSFLGERYSGPLKMNDRILELEGKPIANPRQYLEMMRLHTENKHVVVMILRGKDRIRLDTTVVPPRRELGVTARLQARYDPETRQIEVVSRMLTEMRVIVPPQWVPGGLNWNGLAIDEINKPGCILLTMEKEILHAAVCPKE